MRLYKNFIEWEDEDKEEAKEDKEEGGEEGGGEGGGAEAGGEEAEEDKEEDKEEGAGGEGWAAAAWLIICCFSSAAFSSGEWFINCDLSIFSCLFLYNSVIYSYSSTYYKRKKK